MNTQTISLLRFSVKIYLPFPALPVTGLAVGNFVGDREGPFVETVGDFVGDTEGPFVETGLLVKVAVASACAD
jgi:hypothetical protein